MVNKSKWLIGLLVFNVLTAMAGGLALMNGTIAMDDASLAGTGFASFYFPGIILFAIVGGSSLIAAMACYKNTLGKELAALAAGVIMLIWIIGEVVSIRQFHWLQAPYLLSSATVLILISNSKPGKAVR